MNRVTAMAGIFVSVLGATAPAQAGCTLSNLAGTWGITINGIADDTYWHGVWRGYAISCRLSINASGQIRPGGNYCRGFVRETRYAQEDYAPLSFERLQVTESCAVNLNLIVDTTALYPLAPDGSLGFPMKTWLTPTAWVGSSHGWGSTTSLAFNAVRLK